MLKTISALCLFLIGAGVFVYPWVDDYVQSQKQTRLLQMWDSRYEHTTTENRSASDPAVAPTLAAEPDSAESPEPLATRTTTAQPEPFKIDGQTMIGTISVGKIELREPILDETTDKTLKVGIGNVITDRLPGEPGNLVLAGHRSFTYGKQFSRLDELEQQDEIVIDDGNAKYLYEVTEKFRVTPDDLSVLEQNEHEQELTLITCHPARNPTHRLIVKAVLKDTRLADAS